MFQKLFGSRHAINPVGAPKNASSLQPPAWTVAAESSYRDGLKHEASEKDYEDAETFCQAHPIDSPKFLESHLVDRIKTEGASAWQLASQSLCRLRGSATVHQGQCIHVTSRPDCADTCLISDLPIIAGQYSTQDQLGVYFEITVQHMDENATVALGKFTRPLISSPTLYISIVSIGTVCQPYPLWRLPGWNRQSAGLHLDDMRKFFEDPDGGRDYTGAEGSLQSLNPNDTFGFAYEFHTGNISFTRNGEKLSVAFYGKYLPILTSDGLRYDVYAAIGICGQANVFINFGTEPFKWEPANSPEWRVENHVGKLSGSKLGNVLDDELPAYT